MVVFAIPSEMLSSVTTHPLLISWKLLLCGPMENSRAQGEEEGWVTHNVGHMGNLMVVNSVRPFLNLCLRQKEVEIGW